MPCLHFFQSQGHFIMITRVLWLSQRGNSAGTHIHRDTALVTLLRNVAGHYYVNEQKATLVNYCVCLHVSEGARIW